MNLIELFDALAFPEEGNEKTYNAVSIAEHPDFRIATNIDGYPVLLLSIINSNKGDVIKNYRLKYFQLTQNVECKITENNKSSFQTFTVITFTSSDRNLQEYFLRISETLIKTISNKPTQQQVIDSLDKFVEVFRSLADTPTNTVHGLWSELFLIERSKDPVNMLNYWHQFPYEKYDFNSGVDKIEVKSNSNFERVHVFSSEQLNPPVDTNLLIASLFIRQNSMGWGIQQLMDSIAIKIKQDTFLVEKLYTIVTNTLGNSFEHSINLKFDYHIAEESLQFYNYKDIKKIDEVYIPNEITEVKYKSDLTLISPINAELYQRNSLLFKSI